MNKKTLPKQYAAEAVEISSRTQMESFAVTNVIDYCGDSESLELVELLDDTIIVRPLEVSGSEKLLSGIIVAVRDTPFENARAWRKGVVLLTGKTCNTLKVGDIVLYSNEKGLPISDVSIAGVGVVANARALAESKIFGILRRKDPIQIDKSEKTSRKAKP